MNKNQRKRYAEAISMWCSSFNSAEIAHELKLPEHIVARWIANFQDVMRAK